MTINTKIQITKAWNNDFLGLKGVIIEIIYTNIEDREIKFYRIKFDNKKIPSNVFCETCIKAL